MCFSHYAVSFNREKKTSRITAKAMWIDALMLSYIRKTKYKSDK